MKNLFRALAHLPLAVLHFLGAAMGWAAFLLSPTYRRRFLANAAQAGLSFADVRAAIGHTGKMLGEAPRLWFGKPPPVTWEGAHHVEAALAQRRGTLLLTPHLGCFEVVAQAFAERFGPLTVLYRPARKAWLRELVDTARERANLATAPATLAGVRQMLRVLRTGGVIGLLPDQVPPEGMGMWAPFFGRDAYTMTLPARMSHQTGAVIVLLWGERLPFGRGYRVHARPWEGELSADPAAAAAQVNSAMEQLVRECPSQYLWGYARYKTPRQGLAP